MTRQDNSRAAAEWMQAVLASDEDLLARVLELGLQALMEAGGTPTREASPSTTPEPCPRRVEAGGVPPRSRPVRPFTT